MFHYNINTKGNCVSILAWCEKAVPGISVFYYQFFVLLAKSPVEIVLRLCAAPNHFKNSRSIVISTAFLRFDMCRIKFSTGPLNATITSGAAMKSPQIMSCSPQRVTIIMSLCINSLEATCPYGRHHSLNESALPGERRIWWWWWWWWGGGWCIPRLVGEEIPRQSRICFISYRYNITGRRNPMRFSWVERSFINY